MCNLRGIAHLESVIPLRLTGGAFAVYQQLPDADKRDSEKITNALRTAFAVDSFTAYEQFVGRRLLPGETVDVFLAELRRLAVPFGGLSDKMLACAFVAGLPDTVKQPLRAGSRMDELPLAHILTRARAILTDEVGVAAAVSAIKCVIGVMAWVTLRRRVRETRTGEAVCASLQSRHPVSAAALPVTNICVDGAICLAHIDSGCSHCIVHAPYCASWTRKSADVMTVSGQRQRCEGVGRVKLRVGNGSPVMVDVYVVDFKPLGFEFILGINCISALGGVTILPSLATRFGSAKTDERPVCAVATQLEKPVCAVATKVEKPVYAYAVGTKVERPVCAIATKVEKPVCAIATKVEKPVCAIATNVEKPVCAIATNVEKPVWAIEIDEPDFCVSFDASEKAWTVTWEWSDDAEPHALRNRVTEYSIPTSARLSYEAEIEEWITNGWLEPYDDEKLGPAKGLIPLMAIVQQNNDKVRPVMDIR